MTVAEPALDADDIQGHVLIGFGRAYEMILGLSFEQGSVAEARPALRAIAAEVTPVRSAATAKALRRLAALAGDVPVAPTAPSVAMAFSRAGLARFGANPAPIVDPVFQRGPAATARELGDEVDAVGRPVGWRFGDRVGSEPDVLFVIASADEGEVLAAADRYVVALGGLATVVVRECGRRIARDAEHFGFVDGISQPGVRGMVDADTFLTPRVYPATDPQGAMWARPGQRLTWPGQFVFGYPGLDPDAIQQPGADVGGADPFLRNGSLLVVRRLSQDVGAFWRAMAGLAGQLSAATGSPWTAEMAAARCVGRWRDGTPASLSPGAEDAAVSGDFYRRNGFRYVDAPRGRDADRRRGRPRLPRCRRRPSGFRLPVLRPRPQGQPARPRARLRGRRGHAAQPDAAARGALRARLDRRGRRRGPRGSCS